MCPSASIDQDKLSKAIAYLTDDKQPQDDYLNYGEHLQCLLDNIQQLLKTCKHIAYNESVTSGTMKLLAQIAVKKAEEK